MTLISYDKLAVYIKLNQVVLTYDKLDIKFFAN